MRSEYTLSSCELCFVRSTSTFPYFLMLPVTICSKCLKELWESDPSPDAEEFLKEKIPGLIRLFEQELISTEQILPTIELKERRIFRLALVDAKARLDAYQNHPEEIEGQLAELISMLEVSKAAGDSLRQFKKKHSFQYSWWKSIPKMVWECCRA